jgi:hypothetical protein
MKKLAWLMALLAALALLVTGCPGGGDPEDEDGDEEDKSAESLYLSATEGGTAVTGNTITITEANQNIYVYFAPLGKNFDKLTLNFTASPGENLTVTAIYGMHNDATCTWGKQTWDTNWYDSGPIEIDTTAFTLDWSNTGAGGIDKATIKGFCINIASETTFTLTGVTFTGVGKDSPPPPPPPPPVEDSPIKIYFKGAEKNGIVKGSNSVTVSNNSISVAWNEQDQGGAFRVQFELSEAERVDLSSGYSKFVMEWTSGSAAGGNFNISLYFPDNRMLSNYAGSGSAEFDFIDNHPDWAAGTSWGGASVGTITGFEIFSDDASNFGSNSLVITRIGFE